MARILRLALADWRNYAALDLACDAPLVAFFGENGSGKTNLLEAVSLFAAGRGLRRAAPQEIARRDGAGGFAVMAEVEGALGRARLGCGYDDAADPASRRIRIDGETAASATAFAAHLRVLWLTPEQDGLFRGAPGDRRRFLDRMVLAVDPAHGARVTGFERLLRERNRLLEGYDPDARWLQAIEQEAAELGVAIAAARVDAVRRLAPLLEAEAMAPFPAADVAIEGTLERRIGAEPAAGTESWYREALRAGRGADRAARRALVGPQDADLIVRHRAKAMPAALSSTGEQKALLIGLVLAQARLVADRSGDPPILLLDEVAAHLDPGRRRALFALLETLGGQCLMTGVEEALFAGAPPGLLAMRVAGGAVGQAAPASPTGQATPVPPSPQ